MKNGMHVDRWGNKRWYLNGWLHREDGPAYEGASSYKAWYKNGVLHRLDGPAIEDADGYKVWYNGGMWHREDGPAIEEANGDKAWYLNNEEYSFDEWLEEMNFSDEDKVFLKLKWT